MNCINIDNGTREHYVDQIDLRLKDIETRTKRAWKIIKKATGIQEGERIGIVSNSVLVLVVTFEGVKDYEDREDFHKDDSRHHVPAGSRYDYDDRKGKVGIILSNPTPCCIPLPKLHRVQGYRIVEGV